MHVDMATYKAEFYSHYYEGKLRPRQAYSMGWIMHAARLAARLPGIANFLTHAPGLDRLSKWAAGIAQQRDVPAFAQETFQDWWRKRPAVNEGRPKVILWPDTFNNHFHPETARAAVEVLEDAGYRVAVPEGFVCCGRPLYDWGMLDEAKAMLCGLLDRFQPEIEAGTPIVGLEPSCVAVFRDEMMNMLPNDADAKRLNGRFFTLAEFLMEHADGYQPPKLRRRAVLHGHCHHKSVMKMDADRKLLSAMGVDFDFLDDGCCGMAGSFGFEEGDHYDVSIKAGERVLLPRVRDAKEDDLILTDGFSCRDQIQQGTPRRALHLAQVLQMALHEGEAGAGGAYPERSYVPDNERAATRSARRALGAGAAALAAGALALTLWKSNRTDD
jgi:Fe-S oxidoreductase